MTKLRLAALAACAALIPSTASAEQPGAGHSWREGSPPPVVRPAPPPVVRHAPPEMRREMHRSDGHRRGGTRHFVHRRIDRGGFVPQFWWGPQFIVPSWQMYGFPQPFAGGRWIRYYDDALLIDRDGRVHDSRYGWDWSRERDRWREDGNGVPVYVGDGDYEPQEWDYEWAERWEEGDVPPDDYAHGGYDYEPLPGYEDCGNPCVRTYQGEPPPLPDMRGYCCGPVVITETVTTTGPVYEERVYYDRVEERRPVRKRKAVRRPAPPRPGERG